MKNWLLIFFLILLGFLAYQPSLDAEFVYDDNRQIEANQLIQNPQFYRQALLSDVWSFKADGQTAVSNYWRPTFVAWMIVNYQLAGLNPFYWHLANLLLHLLVAVLLFYLLRCWSLSFAMSLATVALFTLHPVHVESVAWVAGSPDLLFSLFIVSALLCWQLFISASSRQIVHWLLVCCALLFYALALGAKEVAILFPPIFTLLAYWQGEVVVTKSKLSDQPPNKNMMAVSLLFVAVAVVYFILRYQVLGYVSKPQSAALSTSQFIYTLPQVLLFYWQQLFLPLDAAANFPPRVLTEPSLFKFIIPLILNAIMVFVLFKVSRKSRFQTLGLLILLLPLLPALNLFAFQQEQLVHHRYLYFPVLGLLMILLPAWQTSMGQKHQSLTYLLLALLLFGYTYQSWQFSQIWQNNRILWQHTTQVDPNSAFNWQQLANVHLESNQLPQAISAFAQSIRIQATPRSLYGLAKAQHLTGEHDMALTTLQKTISQYRAEIDLYLAYQIYELYAVILTETNQLVAAENLLLKAINEMPEYHVLLADKLAVVLYLQNKKSAALQLLTEVQQSALQATHTAAKLVFFRMAMLYQENNQVNRAKASFKTFLTETQSNADPSYQPYQKIAQDYLNNH